MVLFPSGPTFFKVYTRLPFSSSLYIKYMVAFSPKVCALYFSATKGHRIIAPARLRASEKPVF